MDLNIFIVLLFTLFAGGHSLKCYQCSNDTGSCAGVETTCNATNAICSSTTTSTFGNITSTTQSKDCDLIQNCGNGSFNFGDIRLKILTQCCNTDLCNSKDVTDYISNSPNGKQCYYCDWKSCLNKLNCLGNEDYCLTTTSNITDKPVTKGCITKSICDSASQGTQGFKDFTCCQGNLCNSAKSITQNLLFVSWPLLFYILNH
ncbi:urokinase plasminogen activator surface receptor-like [Misgurnus anguillicaudatus]|uniref:urokinase plasminogen activator surface receptor-like n=1 Tax=Misgurnus anguillicaudatus TaxID=75329 RepID=UPI003CCF60E2